MNSLPTNNSEFFTTKIGDFQKFNFITLKSKASNAYWCEAPLSI